MKNNTYYRLLTNLLIVLILVDNPIYAAAAEDYNLGRALLKFVFYIIIIFLVLIATIYGTRLIAKNTRRFTSSNHIKIVDSLNLGINFKIIMIEINDYIYIMAINNNNIEIIDKIMKDKFKNSINFDDQLQRYRKEYGNPHYFKRIQSNIKDLLKRSINDIDKEEEYDEKKD